jgi:putative transposase
VIQKVLYYREDQKRIGTRKLFEEMKIFLEDHNFKLGRDALFDLLRDRQLLVRKWKRRGPTTTFSKHRFKKYPNIIKDFIPSGPNQLWVSDITYLKLPHCFIYLSLITDAYSRKIVGFSLRTDLSAKGPLEALNMALNDNPDIINLIHHSDRGVQYCCDAYVALLNKTGIKISMTENGDPLENAIAERVNGILKQELLEDVFENFEQAEAAVVKACQIYNHVRPHSSIDLLKPGEAHQRNGPLQRRWKNYYSNKKNEEPLI